MNCQYPQSRVLFAFGGKFFSACAILPRVGWSMDKIKTSLQKTRGRKNKMLDYLLTWGGIYLPIGVVFFLLALEKDGGDLVAFILCGILFSFLGLMAMSKA